MIVANPFPTIQTQRMTLRRPRPEDAKELFLMRSHPEMHTYTDTLPDGSIADTQLYIEKMLRGMAEDKWVLWVMELSGQIIGTVSIWDIDRDAKTAELGYGVHPDYRRQGLMREALRSVADYGFSAMGLACLDAYTEEENLPSRALLERSGFAAVGTAQDPGYYHDRVYNMVIYRLTNKKSGL